MSDFGFVEEALRLVDAGNEAGIAFRIAGACAVQFRCGKSGSILKKIDRRLTDIDLISLGKLRGAVPKLLAGLGYKPNEHFNLYHGQQRQIFIKESPHVNVDVFFDELFYSHVINFRDRLKIDYPTIPLAELLLEKNQIAMITNKDLKDSAALLATFPVGDQDLEMINGKHIARILSRDWGFYKTFVTNLGYVKEYLTKLEELSDEEKSIISDRIAQLCSMVECEPKALAWKLRATVGTRVKWYSTVDEAQR